MKSRQNQASVIRPEIPNGRSMNNLTTAEIINFLTGGCRLSKARSNDLFWEAIWPRLLDRGWNCTVAIRRSLVFLIPGVKKFSRRKLVKGDHYYDSIADILNKVASDPSLIDLDDETEGRQRMIIERDYDHDELQHFYLKPRTLKRNGGRVSDIIYSQNHIMNSCSYNEETDEFSTEFVNKNGIKLTIQRHDAEISARKEEVSKFAELHNKRKNKVRKIQRAKLSNRGSKQTHSNDQSFSSSDSMNSCKMLYPFESSTISVSTPPKAEQLNDKPQMRTMLDLNALPNSEENENATMIIESEKEYCKTRQPSEDNVHNVAVTSYDFTSDQSAAAKSRRHGTRNRPPTARALEAVAAGYLTAAHKRKCKDDYLHSTKVKISRRPRCNETKQLRVNEAMDAIANYTALEKENQPFLY